MSTIVALKKSILATLAYSDYFDFPLLLSELHSRLVNIKQPVKDKAKLLPQLGSLSNLQQALDQLISQHKICKTGSYYHLPGRSQLIMLRRKRQKFSTSLVSRTHRFVQPLSRFPFVLAIFVTGSLAINNSKVDDDLDLMIITKPHRLWLTRLLLTLYTDLRGWRRHPGDKHVASKLCLNLYLSPPAYTLPETKRSLYTAYELIQAVPIYDSFNTRFHLLSANPWIHDYLPNFVFPKPTKVESSIDTKLVRSMNAVRRSDLLKPGQTLMCCIESICYHLQLFYMHRKITHEHITPDSAFFHPHDLGTKVIKTLRGLNPCLFP